MGSLSDLFLKYSGLLEDAFDLDEHGNLIEKNASKILEADSLFHDVFVSDMHEMLSELAYDPHAPQHIESPWTEYPSWLIPYSGGRSGAATASGASTPTNVAGAAPNAGRMVTKVRTSRPDLIHGSGNGPAPTGAGPAYGTVSTSSGPGSPGGIKPGSGSTIPAQIVSILKGRGWSDAAIHGALANAVGEGGLEQAWKQSTVPSAKGPNGFEDSWGPWQFHKGGELDGYYKWSREQGIKNPEGNVAGMTNYMAQRVESSMPGYAQHTDPKKAIDQFHIQFERPADKTPGTRYQYLPQAQQYFAQAQKDIANQPQTQMASNTGANLGGYATGNARIGGASSVERVHPEFASRIDNMVKAMPPELAQRFQITSGFRDPAREQEVYRTQHPGQRVPTDSYHNHGMAVDINRDREVQDWINQNGKNYGVGFTINHLPGEDNHLEPTENGARVPHAQVAQWSNSHMPQQQTQVAQNNTAAPLANNVTKPAAIQTQTQTAANQPQASSSTPAPAISPPTQTASTAPPPVSAPPTDTSLQVSPDLKNTQMSSARRIIPSSHLRLSETRCRTAIQLLRG